MADESTKHALDYEPPTKQSVTLRSHIVAALAILLIVIFSVGFVAAVFWLFLSPTNFSLGASGVVIA